MAQPQPHCRTHRPWTVWGLWLAIGIALLLTAQVWRRLGEPVANGVHSAGSSLMHPPAPRRR